MKNIFNIFSKEKQIEKDSQKVIVDHREKNSSLIHPLNDLGIELDYQNLKVGDYVVRGVVIERKTVYDFISSMINKRLIYQLEELQQYEDRLLMIEGIDEQDLYTDTQIVEGLESHGIHPNAVRGFLLSIVLRFKVPIIFTKNSEDSAKFIAVLLKRKKKEISLNAKKKAFTKHEQMQFIVESFPGIGPKTAKKILGKFKTIKNFMNASAEELKEVLGKKAEIILKIIEDEY